MQPCVWTRHDYVRVIRGFPRGTCLMYPSQCGPGMASSKSYMILIYMIYMWFCTWLMQPSHNLWPNTTTFKPTMCWPGVYRIQIFCGFAHSTWHMQPPHNCWPDTTRFQPTMCWPGVTGFNFPVVLHIAHGACSLLIIVDLTLLD